ncbi:MAG TPA: hypothetical protein VKQ32_27650 [Polyangia bacterium]|nr:hypothetical protein [Polyangia bacterium]
MATVTATRRPSPLVFAVAAALGCGPSFQAARLSQPVSMSPIADATISVEAGRIMVTDNIVASGMGDDTALGVEIGITNTGRAPYSLSAASLSCLMELSPDLPGETLSLAPAGGGEGAFPPNLGLDDLQLGSATIPPGESRRYWVVFRGYRYDRSDAPRKITVTLPDARGRRVQLVIADPARGQLRWEMKPPTTGLVYGIQNTSLFAPGLTASAMAGNLAYVGRAGAILWDGGLTSRFLVEPKGNLNSPTSTFMGSGVSGHVAWPFWGWGAWQDPRRVSLFGGGEAQVLIAVMHPPPAGQMPPKPIAYGALSAEAGLELDIGALRPAPSPFPISWSGPSLPRWSLRAGYTHWFAGGLNSGGYMFSLRLAW